MRRTIVMLGALVVLVLAIVACVFEVPETEYAIVARFGDPRRVITAAGLHLKWPPPIDTLIRIDRRLHVLDPEPSEYLTSEKKNVLVDSFMAWSVADPRKYLVTVTDRAGAEARLTDIMRSDVGSIIGSHPLSVLVSAPGSEGSDWSSAEPARGGEGGTRELTMEDVMREITSSSDAKARESFGIQVAAVRIKRLNFPLQNKTAVFRRMEAERERIAKQYRSEGEEEKEKLEAKVDLEQAQLINEASRRAEEIRGEADAEATRVYAEAYGEDPLFYEFLRSLEAYQKIIRENSTIVVPNDSPLLKVLKDPEACAPPEKADTPSPQEGRQ
ncbi:MAG: protease modulator HflC [Planctomycetota bacterium]